MTRDYYELHADRFIAETDTLDLRALHARFLAAVPPGGRLLDAGCGAGRDAAEFLRRGYEVTAFDASPRLVAHARKRTGLDVEVRRFEDVSYDGEFDGIWACASLLHVPRTDIDAALTRLVGALRVGGVLYLSFKRGRGDEVRDGRLFCDYDVASLRALLARQRGLRVLDVWVTGDVRETRPTDRWVNGLAVRDSRRSAHPVPGAG